MLRPTRIRELFMKQKILTLLFPFIINTCSLWAYTFVQTIPGEGITYEFETENHTAKIVGTDIFVDSDIKIKTEILWADQYYKVVAIGKNAFRNSKILQSIDMSDTAIDSIGDGAFEDCINLTSLQWSSNIHYIGNYAFKGCNNLTSVSFDKEVYSIGDYAFAYCDNLTSASLNCFTLIAKDYDSTINESPKIYPIHKIFYNTPLKHVYLGSAVTRIGDYMFSNCHELISITIPNHVNYIGKAAFSYCENLKSFQIPNQITSIERSTFYECSSLTSVTIPSSVTHCGQRAFYNCVGLQAVHISDLAVWCKIEFAGGYNANPTSYAHNLYLNGELLTDLVIPESVDSISHCAFDACTCLTSLTIHDGLTFMGYDAFYGCTNLKSVTCMAVTPPQLYAMKGDASYNVFYNVECSKIPLYVPAGGMEAYQEADQWKDFVNILPIQEAIETMVTDIQAEPADNSVVIEWPSIAEATNYTIEIKKNGELICTLTFNELGQLQNIAFTKPSRNGGHDNQVRTATQTTTGWKYTVAGLEPNTTYSYNVIAKRNASDTDNLYDKTITFTTKNTPTDIDAVVGADSQSKQIRNGQLFIFRDGKMYNAQGARVE